MRSASSATHALWGEAPAPRAGGQAAALERQSAGVIGLSLDGSALPIEPNDFKLMEIKTALVLSELPGPLHAMADLLHLGLSLTWRLLHVRRS